MPPKKGKKMNLNEFLGDNTLGSWADEMDSLPSAPAQRTDEEMSRDRYGRGKDDFLSSRPDRAPAPPREDLPLPTQPPYTAFVGNLAFDMTEDEMSEHFGASQIKTVKIIKDREEKPKGFGYIEFVDVEGLKNALAKSGTELSNRTIRVSVAEPPKERAGGGGFEDSAKFDSPWRRDGPLPPLAGSDPPRRRYDSNASERPAAVSEGASDWRSSRPRAPPPPANSSDPEGPPPFKRKGSGFGTDIAAGAADREDSWSKGSKFKPSEEEPAQTGSKFGSYRGGRDRELPREVSEEDSDWRGSARRAGNVSPTGSTPPTPQLSRRKLELLPRSSSNSAVPSPLSSPKLSQATAAPAANRASPFGGAKPVDVTSREKEVSERLEKDREAMKDKFAHPMSRTSSRTGSERPVPNRTRTSTPPPTSPVGAGATAPAATSSKISTAANVQPTISFANMASRKDSQQKTEDSVPKDAAANVSSA